MCTVYLGQLYVYYILCLVVLFNAIILKMYIMCAFERIKFYSILYSILLVGSGA